MIMIDAVMSEKQLASGMRQLAGTKTRYRRADAAPLTGLTSDRGEYKSLVRLVAPSSGQPVGDFDVFKVNA